MCNILFSGNFAAVYWIKKAFLRLNSVCCDVLFDFVQLFFYGEVSLFVFVAINVHNVTYLFVLFLIRFYSCSSGLIEIKNRTCVLESH